VLVTVALTARWALMGIITTFVSSSHCAFGAVWKEWGRLPE